jgi:hypothetical protein
MISHMWKCRAQRRADEFLMMWALQKCSTEGSLCALMDFQGTWRHVNKVIEACWSTETKLHCCFALGRLPPNCHCLLGSFLYIRCSRASTTVLILFMRKSLLRWDQRRLLLTNFYCFTFFAVDAFFLVGKEAYWRRWIFWKISILHICIMTDFTGSTALISSGLSLPVGV